MALRLNLASSGLAVEVVGLRTGAGAGADATVCRNPVDEGYRDGYCYYCERRAIIPKLAVDGNARAPQFHRMYPLSPSPLPFLHYCIVLNHLKVL